MKRIGGVEDPLVPLQLFRPEVHLMVMMSCQVTAPPLDRRPRSISGDAPQNPQYGVCLSYPVA